MAAGRLEADAELYGVLGEENFGGPLWEHYAEELARYGCAVMAAWLRTGLIIKECRRHGRPVELPGTWTPDDQWEVVLETVAKGLENFKISLCEGRWSAEAGASLRTYFAGSCVRAFPNVVRAFIREQDRWTRAGQAWEHEAELAESQSHHDPMTVIDARHSLEAMVADSPERTKAIQRLSFDGYSVKEIADALEMTPSLVSAALHRARVRARLAITQEVRSSR